MSHPSRRTFLRQAAATGFAAALTGAGTVCPGKLLGAETAAAARFTPSEPPNQPIGQAQGIFPGRVAWIHDPQVARWDGNTDHGGWFEDKFTDPVLAGQMLSKALRSLTGVDRCGRLAGVVPAF